MKEGILMVSGESIIRPNLKEADFVSSSLGAKAKLIVANEGFRTYRLEGILKNGIECGITLTFQEGILKTATLIPRWSEAPKKWADWSLDKELEYKEMNDRLIRESLGSPPYQYEWGNVSSTYDAKSGYSVIVFQYSSPE
jgi:hypothetical protein